MVLGYSPPDLQMDAKDGADPFAFDGRSKMLRGSAWDALADWGFGARLATLATLQSVVLMNLRKSDSGIDAVTANASSTISLGPYFAGHHQPLRVWILCLYFMGLNLSNSQIAKELELDPDSAHEMATLLRNGILAKEPEVILSGAQFSCMSAWKRCT